ncbi:AAEL016994-PA, partial [Aedes aegypti]
LTSSRVTTIQVRVDRLFPNSFNFCFRFYFCVGTAGTADLLAQIVLASSITKRKPFSFIFVHKKPSENQYQPFNFNRETFNLRMIFFWKHTNY